MKNFGRINCDKSDINIMWQMINNYKQIPFENLPNYCKLKKNQNFLKKRFRKLGYVPTIFVKNDMLYHVDCYTYTFRGRVHEELSCLPIVSAKGRFKRFEIEV